MSECAEDTDDLWPSADYARAVARLRQAVGQPVYLVEVRINEIQAAATLSDKAYELLAVVEFPRPDPKRRLFPHLIVLDDGRGINLGHLARISLNTPFAPTEPDILFQERTLLEEYLFAPSRFDKAWIAAASKRMLGEVLGKPEEELPKLPMPPRRLR
jgi:hypothetical protein